MLYHTQDRFVKLDGAFMRYYKTSKDAEESGSIDLGLVDSIRTLDYSAGCKTFEIQDDNERVYVFEASDPAEMRLWLASIDLVRDDLPRREPKQAQQSSPTASAGNRSSVNMSRAAASAFTGRSSVTEVLTTPSKTLAGPLLKKSNNKYQIAMQVMCLIIAV